MKASRGRMTNQCPVIRRYLALVLALVVVPVVGATTSATAEASVQRTGYVAVRDGTLLKYTVVLPNATGRFPTLMEYSGYDPGTVPDAPYIEQEEANTNRRTPASRAARARAIVPSRFTSYVHSGFRSPSGSFESAARWTTASNPPSA